MKKLILELTTEKDNHEFIYALQEMIKQIENECSSGYLSNEDIESGYWKITEEK